MEKLFTMPQVAEYLQISLRTVNTLVSRGELSIIKVGKSNRISESALKDYLEKGKK